MVVVAARDDDGARETTLSGLPCLTLGSGPPVVVLVGLTSEHRVPTGMEQRNDLRMVAPLAERFTVHMLNRRPGLPPGTRMQDLADHVAVAINDELDGRVPVVGISTGASIALQLAVDHPRLVERLVVWSGACRLGEDGKRRQRALIDRTRDGSHRRAWAAIGGALAGGPVTAALMTGLLWLTGPWTAPKDPGDMLATLEAEDSYDVTDRLHRVTAPTLVIAGARDGFYSRDVVERTASGIRGARLVLYPRKGHMAAIAHRPAGRAVTHFLTGGPREQR